MLMRPTLESLAPPGTGRLRPPTIMRLLLAQPVRSALARTRLISLLDTAEYGQSFPDFFSGERCTQPRHADEGDRLTILLIGSRRAHDLFSRRRVD